MSWNVDRKDSDENRERAPTGLLAPSFITAAATKT